MSAMTDYLEGELIKHIFRTGSFTKPSTVAIGLFTAAPTDAGGGTEVSGNGYSRSFLSQGDSNWTAPSSGNGTTSNVFSIPFATPTGAGWGTVTHFGVFDSTTGGNMLFWGALSSSITINAGDTVSFAPGQLQVTFA